MADHSQLASFRPPSANHRTSRTDNKFTLHLPPTSRRQVAGDHSAADAGTLDDGVVAGDEEEEEEEEEKVDDRCPDCGQRTVRKCLIHADVALVLCVDKSVRITAHSALAVDIESMLTNRQSAGIRSRQTTSETRSCVSRPARSSRPPDGECWMPALASTPPRKLPRPGNWMTTMPRQIQGRRKMPDADRHTPLFPTWRCPSCGIRFLIKLDISHCRATIKLLLPAAAAISAAAVDPA
ncbi:hypothetical protein V1517DRAFT_318972 [Lipomyces orientalis]|uniref:Uncharacterized protein n=1 Tax=Lipomyces orientalis TaxID=1233043 RepID=A0ACC3TT86_9ASCO